MLGSGPVEGAQLGAVANWASAVHSRATSRREFRGCNASPHGEREVFGADAECLADLFDAKAWVVCDIAGGAGTEGWEEVAAWRGGSAHAPQPYQLPEPEPWIQLSVAALAVALRR